MPLAKLNLKRIIIMKKSNKLIMISLIATVAIYGTYKVVLANNNSEQKLAQKVSERINEQNTSNDLTQEGNDSKLEKVTKKVKKVLKKITKPKSDELVINDNEDEEEDCYRQVYIPGAQELCLDEEEDDYTIVSDGTREGRKQALTQKALEIKEKNFGGKSPIDDPSIGSRVCGITLFENLYTKSHQYDQYRILFCNNKGQVASMMNAESGGIDNDGIEYILPEDYKPYTPSIVISEDYKGMETEEELKKRSEFNSKKELPRDVGEVTEIIANKLENGTSIASTRLITVNNQIMPTLCFYEVNVKGSNGDIGKYYTGAFAGSVVFSEKEFKSMYDNQKAQQKVLDNLSSEQWHKLESSGKLDAYLDEKVPVSEKEKKYFQELDEYHKKMNYIQK